MVTFSLLLAAQDCFAKEWRGIAPLRSTRADVVRLLKQCSDQIEACAFSLAQEEVYILFSGGLSEKEEECARRLPPETVVFIQVWPKSKPRLNDLHLDKKNLKAIEASRLNWHHKAFLAKEGLVIDTSRGKMIQLVYIANPSDAPLCPGYFEEPGLFIQSFRAHPPFTMSIDCPNEAVTPGTKLVLRSTADIDSKRGPTWTVNAGRIIGGQHTNKITLDTAALSGRIILVNAKLSDGFSYYLSTSCKIAIAPK